MHKLSALLFAATLAVAQGIPEYEFSDIIGKAVLPQESDSENLPINNLEELAADAPLSEDAYTLGPGDVLALSFGSSKSVTVSPEGTLNLAGFPPLQVSGLSLTDAKKSIKRLVSKSYDTSRVYVSLTRPNQFKVWVMGEVLSPGAKNVNSFLRLTDLLELAEGFSPSATRSRVRIKHLDGKSTTVNLIEFYRSHDLSHNPTLKFGDIVTVDKIDFTEPYAIVHHDGALLYHSLNEKVSLADLFLQVSGYTKTTDPSYVNVVPRNGKSLTISPDRLFDYFPEAGDTISFSTKKAAVFVGGSVLKPGSYEYIPGLTPLDYAFLAGITGEAASKTGYRIVRANGDSFTKVPRNGTVLPGDKIYMERRPLSLARDYSIIIGTISGIVATSTTLYLVLTTQ